MFVWSKPRRWARLRLFARYLDRFEGYTMFYISNLNRVKNREKHARALVKAFRAFDTVAFEAGVLSAHAKQLISVAVAPTMQCVYRISRRSVYESDSRLRQYRNTSYRDCDGRNGDVRQHHEHAHDEPDDALIVQLIWRAVQECRTQAPRPVFC